MKGAVPDLHRQEANEAPVQPEGEFVRYWMAAFRRLHWNFSLQRAVEWAGHLQKPLVILKPLRVDYPWASRRLHGFVLDGMQEQEARLEASPVLYYPYVEGAAGGGGGLLLALAERACVVVGDDYPCFFLLRMLAAAASRVGVRLEKVDSNGLLPLREASRVFLRAYSFRRFLQQKLPARLEELPRADPLAGEPLPALEELPQEIGQRWPRAPRRWLRGEGLEELPGDGTVGRTSQAGGTAAGQARLKWFLEERLPRCARDRNHPEREATSGLSPYLHFGQISPHQIFHELARLQDWRPHRLSPNPNGRRQGWWGMELNSEALPGSVGDLEGIGF